MTPKEKILDFYSEYDQHLNKISVSKEQQEDYKRIIREQKEERDRKESIRIKRIGANGGNQINYAFQKLIEKATIDAEDIRVSHYDLGFEDTTAGIEDAMKFLNALKNEECFKNFSKLADNSFRIENAFMVNLKNYQARISGHTPQKFILRKNGERPDKLVVDFGANSKWEILTMIMLENFKFKMARGSDAPYELDFQKIGYTKTTDGGTLTEKKFLKDFLLVLAINNGKYNIKGLSNTKKSVVHTRKKEAKNALMESFGFSSDPFKYDSDKGEYGARFKIIPPTNLRPT